MGFYDLSQQERKQKYVHIQTDIEDTLQGKNYNTIRSFFNDEDTYVRKVAYLGIGKIYQNNKVALNSIISCLEQLYQDSSERVRQTVIYSCGEIAVFKFAPVKFLLDKGITDSHHSVRNAAVGSLKKAGARNPKEILEYCKNNIMSPKPEIRRIMCHGLELRGRTYPQDIIDILKLLQYENVKRVKDMLIHVLGQISYKTGCLYYVSTQVEEWDNKEIFSLYINEVTEVHRRYEKFSEFSQEYVISYFQKRMDVNL